MNLKLNVYQPNYISICRSTDTQCSWKLDLAESIHMRFMTLFISEFQKCKRSNKTYISCLPCYVLVLPFFIYVFIDLCIYLAMWQSYHSLLCCFCIGLTVTTIYRNNHKNNVISNYCMCQHAIFRATVSFGMNLYHTSICK